MLLCCAVLVEVQLDHNDEGSKGNGEKIVEERRWDRLVRAWCLSWSFLALCRLHPLRLAPLSVCPCASVFVCVRHSVVPLSCCWFFFSKIRILIHSITSYLRCRTFSTLWKVQKRTTTKNRKETATGSSERATPWSDSNAAIERSDPTQKVDHGGASGISEYRILMNDGMRVLEGEELWEMRSSSE